ncbi:hypothetical protein LCGC14_1657910 [marine sediment metagenome]|uniref:Uncharacterized protein n=1 Tax=marine sediment metagenome TaxID=412755 RepID=A0A0F9KAS2_9ZZZZ
MTSVSIPGIEFHKKVLFERFMAAAISGLLAGEFGFNKEPFRPVGLAKRAASFAREAVRVCVKETEEWKK